MSGKQKKNSGCLSSFIYLCLLLIAFVFLVSIAGWAFAIVGIIALAILLIKGMVFALSKIFALIKSKIHKNNESKTAEKIYDVSSLEDHHILTKEEIEKDIIPETRCIDNSENESETADYEVEIQATEKVTETPKIHKTQKLSSKRNVAFDVEQYARMCNAYLEHEDEMEQYKDMLENQQND